MLMRMMAKSARRGGLRQVVFMLAGAMAIIGLLPQSAGSSVIPADEALPDSALRAEQMATVKAALERKEVAARLADYGLTPEEVTARMDRLSDEQLSEVAGRIDQINAGADIFGTLLTIALLLLVVLVVLHFLGYIDLRLPKAKDRPGI